MSPTPNFPPELIDQTIGHLYLDRASLQSCSLVSRAWLPASRHHLFHNTKLYNEGDKLGKFRKFLEDTPEVPGVIRSLSLRCRESSSTYMSPTAKPNPICVHDLTALISKLPSLKSLKVSHSHIECRCASGSSDPFISRMEHVEIRINTVSRIQDLVDILCRFSTIDHLELACLRPLQPFAKSPILGLQIPQRRFLQTESLKLVYLDTGLLMEILSHGVFSATTLTCLDISCKEMDQVRMLGHLMMELGSRILEFSFDPEELAIREPPGLWCSHRPVCCTHSFLGSSARRMGNTQPLDVSQPPLLLPFWLVFGPQGGLKPQLPTIPVLPGHLHFRTKFTSPCRFRLRIFD